MAAVSAQRTRSDGETTGPAVQNAVLGIDLGTSSVKVVLTTLHAQVLSQASRAYPVLTPGPGQAESDPDDWRRGVITAVREALAQTPQVTVVGIGLSGQMHGVVAADENCRPVRPAILWADARATDQIARYQQLPAERLAALQNPLTPGMAGPILSWLADHEPNTTQAMRWALQPKDWVRAWLTDVAAGEPSDASATLLYDLAADTWALDIAMTLGIDPAWLPPLLPSAGATAGTLTPAAAAQLGLEPGTPVAAGGGDTAVAALGTGLTEPGTVQLTIGTGAQVITPVEPATALIPGHERATHLYRTATATGHYRMAASLNGGLVLSWVRDRLGASWEELYATAETPPAPDGPLFLPHLHGERTPYLSSTMRGAWVGLAPQHTRADLLRATLEGVAFSVKDALYALYPDGPSVDHLRLAGGGTTAAGWRQMLADVLGLELKAVEVTAASGRGAAMLGAQGAGLLDEPELLSRLIPRMDTVAQPDPHRRQSYQHRFERFRDTVRQLNAQTPSMPDTVRA